MDGLQSLKEVRRVLQDAIDNDPTLFQDDSETSKTIRRLLADGQRAKADQPKQAETLEDLDSDGG